MESQNKELVQFAIKKCGKIDLVIANAGIPGEKIKHSWEVPDEHWKKIMDANLNGPRWLVKHAMPFLISGPRPKDKDSLKLNQKRPANLCIFVHAVVADVQRL